MLRPPPTLARKDFGSNDGLGLIAMTRPQTTYNAGNRRYVPNKTGHCAQPNRPLRSKPASTNPPVGDEAARSGGAQDEREHFMQCAACGRWIDMRDLGDPGARASLRRNRHRRRIKSWR